MSRLRRISLAVAAGLLGLLIGTGSAWAYFSTTGHGSGTVRAARLGVQVWPAVGVDPGAELLPGGSGNAVLRLHNPQSRSITLIAVTGAGPVRASHGCPAGALGFTDQAGLDVSIAAGATVLVTLPGAVSLAADADPSCQGAGFAIPVSVTVRS